MGIEKKLKIKILGGKIMLEERILNGDIKLFKVGEIYRIYGKTFEVKDELTEVGAKWNKEKEKLELSIDDFNNLSDVIKRKVFETEEKQRQMSLENIAHIILTGQVKVYLNQDDEYQIYGRTKDIFKDLQNIGFVLNDNNYSLRKDDFEIIFSNEVKEFISEYSNKKSDKKVQEEQQEDTYIEEEYEEELEQ